MLATPLPTPSAVAPAGLPSVPVAAGQQGEGGFGAVFLRATAGLLIPPQAVPASAAELAVCELPALPAPAQPGLPVPEPSKAEAAMPEPVTVTDVALGQLGLFHPMLATAPASGMDSQPGQPGSEKDAEEGEEQPALPDCAALPLPSPAPPAAVAASSTAQGAVPMEGPSKGAPLREMVQDKDLSPAAPAAAGPQAPAPSAAPPERKEPAAAAPVFPPGQKLEAAAPALVAQAVAAGRPGAAPATPASIPPKPPAAQGEVAPKSAPQVSAVAAARPAYAQAGAEAVQPPGLPRIAEEQPAQPIISPEALARPHPSPAIAPARSAPDTSKPAAEPVAAPNPIATAAAPIATAEPIHAPPPSPVRQVLPITIAMLISPGSAPTLTVTLEPGEMGQVEIRIGRDAEGTTLRLIAERPETAALMQRDQRELQQGLAQSGIKLDAAIQFDTAGGGARGQDGQPRDRPPPRQARPESATETEIPLSLLDLRI